MNYYIERERIYFMKFKKLTVILLLIIFFVSQISWIAFNNFSYSSTDGWIINGAIGGQLEYDILF